MGPNLEIGHHRCNELKQGHAGVGWAHILTGVLTKGGNLDTGRTLCEDEGKDWAEASSSQETPEITRKPSETRGEAWRFFPTSPQKAPNLPVSDFWPPEL